MNATHILGGEVGYRHISGLQYEVLVNIYGDCSGNAFPSLANSITEVNIYNGFSLYTTVTCQPYGDFGKEITPVCAADSLNTKCKTPSGAIPGIAEFKYRAIVTLNQPSANWRFAFAGSLGGTSGAGRSNAITNVQIGVNGSLVYLEARLNNSNGPNNSPTLTTVPTPFFCLNQSQEYNTGAVDIDGDSLVFRLVDALEPTANNGVAVTYSPGYSGTQPLAASSFNFSASNGQLSFIPNITQTSTVVNRIEEYKNGVLVGTMMREMNFIVLNNCSNQSPVGSLDTTNAGDIVSTKKIEICNADSSISFDITAFDPDSGNINVTVTGLPPGMSYLVNGNNTKSPILTVNYAVPTPIVPNSNVSFFVTFQDDGCPLSSKQQIAFTIEVIQPLTLSNTVISESCVPGADGIINLTGTSTNSGNLEYSFNGSSYSALNTFGGLASGNYQVGIRDVRGCTLVNNVFVDSATKITIDTIYTTDITCFSKSDGILEVSAQPTLPSTIYSLQPGSQTSSTGRFENLAAGVYTVIANAPLGCSDTSTAQLTAPPDISFTNISIENNKCDKGTGRIEIGSNISIPVLYSISPNQQSNSNGQFGGLSAGYYIITVVDTNGCYKDTILQITDEPNNFALQFGKQDVTCEGDGNNGSAQVVATGGEEPYTYLWTSKFGTEGTQSAIYNQRSGLKRVFVTDAIGCEIDGYTILNPADCCERVFIPNAFTPNGDDKNEEFRLRTPLTMNDVEFFVVNRWGQKVWSTSNHLDGWDGNYADGTPADVGTYFYFLRYQCDSNKGYYNRKGDVIVIR